LNPDATIRQEAKMKYLLPMLLVLCAGCVFVEQDGAGRHLRLGASCPEEQPTTVGEPLVGRAAPEFEAQAVMPDGKVRTLALSDYAGGYVILFFYPADFSRVCPTEIIAFDERRKEFMDLDCRIIGVSTDTVWSHIAWRQTPREQEGIGRISYPLVADVTKDVSRAYGVLKDRATALRGLFIIDPDGVVRHVLINDLPVGRDVDEVKRVLQALRFVKREGKMCGAGWQPGQEGLKGGRE
jgi:peroxiredoxin (alkyl hydroperoxide reductase subunit C)